MATSRDAFLERVRQAVQAGNRAGAGPLEARGRTGYQGAGADPVARFSAECTSAGGVVHIVPDGVAATSKVVELVRERSALKALVGRGEFIDPLDLPNQLRSLGVAVIPVDSLKLDAAPEPLFAAEAGISGVDYLVAETGTVVLQARPAEPRSLSLLPPLHIAIADHSQILPDLFDLFQALDAGTGQGTAGPALPSCLSLITGPSKTGDIELRLVTGVHGPGEIHVVLIAGPQ